MVFKPVPRSAFKPEAELLKTLLSRPYVAEGYAFIMLQPVLYVIVGLAVRGLWRAWSDRQDDNECGSHRRSLFLLLLRQGFEFRGLSFGTATCSGFGIYSYLSGPQHLIWLEYLLRGTLHGRRVLCPEPSPYCHEWQMMR